MCFECVSVCWRVGAVQWSPRFFIETHCGKPLVCQCHGIVENINNRYLYKSQYVKGHLTESTV